MRSPTLVMEWIPGRFAVCRLPPDSEVPAWAGTAGALGPRPRRLLSVTRTDRELSVVAPEEAVPDGVQAERNWVAVRVAGVLDFSLVGVLARLTGALAGAGVPVAALSTYDTDILLVRADDARRSVEALATVADTSRLR